MFKAITRTATVLGFVLAGIASARAADDIGIWRPSTGFWYSLSSASNFTSGWTSPVAWGSSASGDVPFTGDIDGDGKADLGVWRPSTGVWYWLTSSSNYAGGTAIPWGCAACGDVPLVGDTDGDGKTDLIVWRSTTGMFYPLTSSTGYTYKSQNARGPFGGTGDVPFIGDFDGDGRSDLAVWRPSNGVWYWLTSSSNWSGGASVAWGCRACGDVPLLGDIDGDGKADLLVWRAPIGTWFWITSSGRYSYSTSNTRQWGAPSQGDTPVVADFDGDGRADIAVFRPSSGNWFWLTAASGFSTSAYGARTLGGSGDVPLVFRNTRTGTVTTPPPPPTPGGVQLRVLQWNTHHGGYGTDNVYSPDRLATWAAAMRPDVVMFNEIEKNDSWGNQDQPEVYKALLQQKTGKTWYYVFAQEFGQWSANGKGNLILSTYPITASDRYELVHNADRSIAMASITVNGRPITLISTHLDPYDQALRLTQATEVTSWASAQPENRIITGDMNAWPDQTSIAQFNKTYNDSWSVAASQGTATAFSGNTGQTKSGRIDYIFYSKNSPNLVAISSQVYDTRDGSGVTPSDHRPVLTTFVVR